MIKILCFSITELHCPQMRLKSREGTIARLVALRAALETALADTEKRLWASERLAAEFTRGDI